MQTRSYQHLYDYIFGARANIDEAIKNAPLDKKEKIKKTRQEAIQQFFFGKGENESSLIPSHKQALFHVALRNLQAKELETVLYGSHTELKADTKSYFIPDEKQILNQLVISEEKHYLLPTNDLKTQFEKFKAYFYICKIIGDFVEHNNNEMNNAVAFEHAYKLLVLFGESNDSKKWFALFDTYLSTHNLLTKQHPLHDALVSSLPRAISPEDLHLSDWQQIILKTGAKALVLFNRAVEIEKQLNNTAPKDFQEALTTAKKCTYKQSEQDPELAELCLLHNISEKIFNSCLTVKSKQKQKDNLPDISIAGAEVNYPGYFFVKLPIHDPHAFILGHLTNCCQSMGGNSEQCVIDGITLPDNGFYVLLKEKKKIKKQESKLEENHSPFKMDGSIDYHTFEIVGQGYTWISQERNLTIDSWENLRAADDEVITAFLNKFGEKVTEKNYPFTRVTIGRGGKTPVDLRAGRTASKTMLTGKPYGDAKTQSLIYLNPFRQKAMLRKVRKDLNKILKDTQYAGKYLVNKENLISDVKFKELRTLLKNPAMQSYLKLKNLDRFTHIIYIESIINEVYDSKQKMKNILTKSIWDTFKNLNEQNKLTHSNIESEIQLWFRNFPTEISLNLLKENQFPYLEKILPLFPVNENFLNKTLINAIFNSNYEAVKKFLEMKANPNFTSNGWFPLVTAMRNCDNNLNILKVLIEAKANLSVEFEDGKNLLHWSRQYSVSLKKFLITAGVSLFKKDDKGQLPIHNWGDWYQDEIIQSLIEKKYDINSVDFYGNTLLHIPNVSVEVVKSLIATHANVNSKGNLGNTPLHQVKKIEIANMLVEAKADLNAKNALGSSILHRISIPFETLKFFIEHGPTLINSKDHSGSTPLHYVASQIGDRPTPRIDTSMPQDMSDVDILHILLAAKADVNAKNNIQEVPLHIVADKYDTSAMKALIEAKADVDKKDLLGNTPLHNAGNATFKESIKCLLDAKANINLMNNKKETPLFSMIKNYNSSFASSLQSPLKECVKQILDAKADIYSNNESLLHVTIESNLSQHLLSYLLNEIKIDVNAKNSHGLTLLDLAISKNDYYSVKVLLENKANISQKQFEQARNQHQDKSFSRGMSVFPILQLNAISNLDIDWLCRQIQKISTLKNSPLKDQFITNHKWQYDSLPFDYIFLYMIEDLYKELELAINTYNSRWLSMMSFNNPYKNEGYSAIAALLQFINTSSLVRFPLAFDHLQSFQPIAKEFFEPLASSISKLRLG